MSASRSTKDWFVYIAKAKNNRYYTGITTDPKRRLTMHNEGVGSKYAKDFGPFVLVYISKPFDSQSEARKREIRVKDWSQEKKEKLISREWT